MTRAPNVVVLPDSPLTTVPRIAVIGLDGATTRVLDPLAEAGVMPRLSEMRQRAAERTLLSTVPAYTPPAWMSMITGVNPGRHGIFGFMSNTPQDPPEIAHSGSLRAPPLWDYLSAQGVRSGMFHIPMTYPPPQVDSGGFLVSGGLAAGWTDPALPGFSADPVTLKVVHDASGGAYPVDSVVDYERDWRSPATATWLTDIQKLRRRALNALLDHYDPDLVFAVFEGPDRLHHVHYQYLVECSDWFSRPEASEIREAAWAYFRELDRAIGDLIDWVGADGIVVVVSDHGAGPWEKTINVNRLLAEWGYLSQPSLGRVTSSGVISGPVQQIARRVIPRRWLQAAKARVNRDIDWAHTSAFASQVAEQGIHMNEKGSLPRGILNPVAAAAAADEIVDRLHALVDPDDGGTVVDSVVRRERVMHGPFASRAPHLFPICRDQRYELSDTLAARTAFTDHRDRPWGYHHSDGVWIASGPPFQPGDLGVDLNIVDVLPTVLHAAGLAIPGGLDGAVASDVFRPTRVREPVLAPAHATSSDRAEPVYPFSPQEEEAIEESLRGLGYLE